jgi:hypothetical protein
VATDVEIVDAPTLSTAHHPQALCEKALQEYLDTKRLAFPRFYFVSSADLLDILSNGNNPHVVAKSLSKLFNVLCNLKFEGDTKSAVGMFSLDGEYVEFRDKEGPTTCLCEGRVEEWLMDVLVNMQETLRYCCKDAFVAYDEKPRSEWVFDNAAQVTLVGTQVWWATEVNIAFARLEEGYENALKEYVRHVLATSLLSDRSGLAACVPGLWPPLKLRLPTHVQKRFATRCVGGCAGGLLASDLRPLHWFVSDLALNSARSFVPVIVLVSAPPPSRAAAGTSKSTLAT